MGNEEVEPILIPDFDPGNESGLKNCALSDRLVALYRHPRLRPTVWRLAGKWEGGRFFSGTFRKILHRHHGVAVGAYSYGECLRPGGFPQGVKVGRWVSVAAGVKVFLRDHPIERLSTHPLFYNKHLGFVEEDKIETGTLEIGHDAWIGERAMITAGCRRIGIGAVLGAGAVLTKDLPDFAVAAGVPARILRYRFSEETQARILESRWWENDFETCMEHLKDMIRPIEDEGGVLSPHPLLQPPSETS